MSKKNVAVIIDVDNFHQIDQLPKIVKNYGELCTGYAAGGQGIILHLSKFIIKLGIDYESTWNGKNITDIHCIIRAMSILHRYPHVDTFIICSGDKDFIPLYLELMKHKKKVIIVCNEGHKSSELHYHSDEVITLTKMGYKVEQKQERKTKKSNVSGPISFLSETQKYVLGGEKGQMLRYDDQRHLYLALVYILPKTKAMSISELERFTKKVARSNGITLSRKRANALINRLRNSGAFKVVNYPDGSYGFRMKSNCTYQKVRRAAEKGLFMKMCNNLSDISYEDLSLCLYKNNRQGDKIKAYIEREILPNIK